MRATLSILILISFVWGCKAAEEYVFQTDLRRKNYPVSLDSDQDGLTDREELSQGFDPDDPDSDNNGIPDGEDDTDGDGMSNAWEVKLGFDPNYKDSGNDKYGSYYKNNGLSDCEEDIDGDGAPNCWEIENGLDPEDPSDQDADNDEDGFSNAEEYPDFDPNDPDSHPTEEKDLVLYDNDLNIEGRTNSPTVRGTVRFCFGGDQVLLTQSATKPEASTAGWVDCTVAALALTTTMINPEEGLNTLYMWRKNPLGVNPKSVKAEIIYDSTGPSGSLEVTDRSFTTIDLAHTAPTESDYSAVILRRFESLTCQDKNADEGTGVTLATTGTSLQDTGLASDTQYCYKVFWYDDLGNEASAVADVETVASKTLAVSGCTVTGHNVWYVGADVEYSVTCENEILSVTDSASTWPSFLSLQTALPADDTYVIAGTPSSALASTNWTALVNTVHNEAFTTKIYDGSGIVHAADTTLALSASTLSNVNLTSTLDADYDGEADDVVAKALAGSTSNPATDSNGNVAAIDSDIPLLKYTDDGACNETLPNICASSSSYDTGSKIASNSYGLEWGYNQFDHGEYFIHSRNFLLIDNAPIYGAVQTTTVTTDNKTNADTEFEAGIPCTGCLGNTLTEGANLWHLYTPAIAIHPGASDSVDQVVGTLFTGIDGNIKQFAGILTIDREPDASAQGTKTKGFQVDASDPDFAADNIQLTNNGNDSRAMAVAATTAATNDEWLSFNVGQTGIGRFDLFVNRFKNDGTIETINLTDFATVTGKEASSVLEVAMSDAYTEGANSYHGVAFTLAEDGAAGIAEVYVSKLRSEPTTFTEANLFVSTSMYGAGHFLQDPADNGGTDDEILDAVLVHSSLGDKTQISVLQAEVSSTDYLFVSWVDLNDDTFNLARVQESNGAVTANTSLIANFAETVHGQSTYSMATGRDESDNLIIGVLYTNTANTACRFDAYNPGTLAKVGSTLTISDYGCRYPQLAFDDDRDVFVAVYANDDDAAANTANEAGDTVLKTFAFDSGQATPQSEVAVTLTVRDGSTNFDRVPCNLVMDYSDALNRVTVLSIEGGPNAGLCDDTDEMIIDSYKLPEN